MVLRKQATLSTAIVISVMNTRHCSPSLGMEMPGEPRSTQDGLSLFWRGLKLLRAATQTNQLLKSSLHASLEVSTNPLTVLKKV